ncbi:MULTISPECIES: DinB family protein [unclassified Actinotalea]|uniref:DinB family protein n=1 Tax=unclassified Actinotalea TaxID=2638618 RepID=UPI0015F3F94B|nr:MULTISPECIES: DinB family protein [unclassified Actinotalea]
MTDETIEPDTKDWTWVTERPCLDCGFHPEAVAGDEIPGILMGYATRWEDVLRRDDVARRPVPKVWSPLEYACHVRDVCDVFAARARLIREQDGPSFENWDQDATAVAERYGEQDPAAVSLELVAAARGAAEAFTGLSDADWGRPGYRSNGSAFTALSLGHYFLHDVAHHLNYDVRG